MNPCRCGYFNDPQQRCRCTTGEPERYVRRVSGPLLDRFDMQIEMARVPPAQLLNGPRPETSATVGARIRDARTVALTRNRGRPNAQLPAAAIGESCLLTDRARRALGDWAERSHASGRSIHRVMRVARTIADLGGIEQVDETHVFAAAQLRDPQANPHERLAA